MKFKFGWALFWFLWDASFSVYVLVTEKSALEMWILFVFFLFLAACFGTKLANLFLDELKNKD